MSDSEIDSVFMVNEISATLIIPYEVVEKKGLDIPENVIVEDICDGILIRRINNLLEGEKNGKQ